MSSVGCFTVVLLALSLFSAQQGARPDLLDLLILGLLLAWQVDALSAV